jgi:hypothetical protein
LLPYYESFGYPKEHGINFYDVNKSIHNYHDHVVDTNNQCQYQIITLDASGSAHTHQCHHYGYAHSILKSKYNNANKYCYNHKLIIVKEIKESEKNEKIKKLEEKNKIKMDLMQQKIDLKKIKSDALCKMDINNNFCNVILKTGKYKGTQCSGKIYKNLICKRHFNVANKYNNNIVDEESEENIVIG